MYIYPMHSELLKGTLQTIILHLLMAEGRMYGYEITRRVAELTGNELQLTEGALYPALHKLESLGLVVTEKEMIGKRVRKYYLPTAAGLEVSAKKKREFWHFVAVMQSLLNPEMRTP